LLPLVIACGLAALPGCRLPCWGGPVSGDVLNCRQHTQRGLSAIDRGEWQEAESALSHAVETCPVDGEARRHYAETLWRRGAHQEAVLQLQEAVRLSGDDPQLVARLGEMHVADGRWQPALDCAQAALDVGPKLARAWVLRAQAMQRGGQPRQALADYHRAIRCDPGNREALLQTAELHRQLDQPQRALAALQCLADTYPLGEEPQHVSYLSGLAYSSLDRHEDAVESYHRAARHSPTPEILFRLAEAELQLGRPLQARDAAQHALALDPRHEPSQTLLNRLAAVPAEGRLQR
jgi:tetratricopeptide (TPR) repeat protein